MLVHQKKIENVYYFGGQTINKDTQMRVLGDNGVPVPKWLVNPKNQQDVFDRLGPEVITKPRYYFSCGGNFVQYVTPETGIDLSYKHRMLFTEYVGAISPPFWRCRIETLLGEVVCALTRKNQDPNCRIVGGGRKGTYEKINDDKILEIGQKTSQIMTEEFGCGIVGIDLVGRDEKYYVVEANPTSTDLSTSPDSYHLRIYHPGERIAETCLKKIKELEK